MCPLVYLDTYLPPLFPSLGGHIMSRKTTQTSEVHWNYDFRQGLILQSWNSIRRPRRTLESTAAPIIKSVLSHTDELLRAMEEGEGGEVEVEETQQRDGTLRAQWFIARFQRASCTLSLAVHLERDPANAVTFGVCSTRKFLWHLLHHLCSSALVTH